MWEKSEGGTCTVRGSKVRGTEGAREVLFSSTSACKKDMSSEFRGKEEERVKWLKWCGCTSIRGRGREHERREFRTQRNRHVESLPADIDMWRCKSAEAAASASAAESAAESWSRYSLNEDNIDSCRGWSQGGEITDGGGVDDDIGAAAEVEEDEKDDDDDEDSDVEYHAEDIRR